MLLTRISPKPAQKQRTAEEILAILDGHSLDTIAGSSVTIDSAMTQTTVWACVRILSESIAQLPIAVQERQGEAWVYVEDHDSVALLAKPNDWQTQHEFLASLVSWMELRGNGFALKIADKQGKIHKMLPLRGDKVEVKQDDNWAISYRYNQRDYTPGQMLHLRNFGTDGFQGLSTIANARNTIGLAMAMEAHGAALFKNGASIGKVLKAANRIDEEAEARLKRRLSEYTGASNAHKTLLLDQGLEIDSISMTNADSQWLEARKLSKSEIATIFGIPDFMLNSTEKSTTWGSGLEQLSQAFVRYTLQPRMSRIAQTLNRELIPEKDRTRFRFVFDTDQMTMGDFAKRMTGYSTAITAGVLSANEAREIEGRNPREGADEYLTPMNMTTGANDENEDTDDESQDADEAV